LYWWRQRRWCCLAFVSRDFRRRCLKVSQRKECIKGARHQLRDAITDVVRAFELSFDERTVRIGRSAAQNEEVCVCCTERRCEVNAKLLDAVRDRLAAIAEQAATAKQMPLQSDNLCDLLDDMDNALQEVIQLVQHARGVAS